MKKCDNWASDCAEFFFTRYIRWHVARGNIFFAVYDFEGNVNIYMMTSSLNPKNTQKLVKVILCTNRQTTVSAGIPRCRANSGHRKTIEPNIVPNQYLHSLSWAEISAIRPATKAERSACTREMAQLLAIPTKLPRRTAIPA